MSDSVLFPSDDRIKEILIRKPKFNQILKALSEQPCYVTELGGRLVIDIGIIRNAIYFLYENGLIIDCNYNSEDERVKQFIQNKQNKLKSKLNIRLSSNTIKRMTFYKITERGEKFI